MNNNDTQIHRSGSQVVAALENAWRQLQKVTPDLPDVVLIVGSGAASGEWGHTWADRWVEGHPPTEEDGDASVAINAVTRKTEVFISGERLACGATLTLQTLCHEAAHVLARVRDVQDTSRQGRYHNRKFVDLAGLYGLEWANEHPHKVIGFSAVTMTADAERRFRPVISRLDKAIRLYLPGFTASAAGTTVAPTLPKGRRPGTGKGSNLVKATCSCDTPRIIRVAPSTLDLAAITCGECGADFTAA
jgi:hypothetical protein